MYDVKCAMYDVRFLKFNFAIQILNSQLSIVNFFVTSISNSIKHRCSLSRFKQDRTLVHLVFYSALHHKLQVGLITITDFRQRHKANKLSEKTLRHFSLASLRKYFIQSKNQTAISPAEFPLMISLFLQQ